jgi:P-type Cu2+ transporter
VSISFASAAPLAQHQADLLVVNGRLDSILQARSTARKALSIVSQSLRFSVAYNVVGIPLAIAGMMPPWLAGLGMACSSLLVVLNALRAGR